MKMKIVVFTIVFIIIRTITVIGQEGNVQNNYKSNTLILNNGIIGIEELTDFYVMSANYERLIKMKKNGYASFSIGAGPLFCLFDTYTLAIANMKTERLIGKRNNFFVIGGGFSLIFGSENGMSPFFNPVIGYRLMAGKNIMIGTEFDMFIPVYMYRLSLSLGFRF